MSKTKDGSVSSIDGVKRFIKRELGRCSRNIDRGGSPSFWLWRLRPVLAGLDEMAAAVRQRIEKLERMDREQAASTFYVCNNCGETRPLPYYALVGCDVCWHKSVAGVAEPWSPGRDSNTRPGDGPLKGVK